MNRKFFLSSFLPSVWVASHFSARANEYSRSQTKVHRKPPYLMVGDKIGITCPAGHISLEEIRPALTQMESWGFKTEIGKTVGLRDFTFGGTDLQRLEDLQAMLDNPELKAIMCARGGYGLIRIIDQLDFTRFKKYPKWIIGFSDITVLHSHINSQLRFASLHAKMCNSFPSSWDLADDIQKATILSIEKVLKGVEAMHYQADFCTDNVLGEAEGELVGGNLRCLENLAGTSSALQTKGKILFLEDVSEPLYNIDRMFYNLLRSGRLTHLKGLIIGGFRVKKDDEGDEFGRSLEQIVLDKVNQFEYPVCFGFPVGHQKANYALKLGVRHRLTVSQNGTELLEIV